MISVQMVEAPLLHVQLLPKGRKIEKIQDRSPGLYFSSEIEISSEPPILSGVIRANRKFP